MTSHRPYLHRATFSLQIALRRWWERLGLSQAWGRSAAENLKARWVTGLVFLVVAEGAWEMSLTPPPFLRVPRVKVVRQANCYWR